MDIEPGPGILALFPIAGGVYEVEGLRLWAGEKELVDKTTADGETEAAGLKDLPVSHWGFGSGCASADLPICAGDQDGEFMLVGDAVESVGRCVHFEVVKE